MAEENQQSHQSSSDEDKLPLSSTPHQMGRGTKLANDIRVQAEALLEALHQLSTVGEGVLEKLDLEDKADDEGVVANFELPSTEVRDVSIDEIRARAVAYLESPGLIARICAKLQAQDRRKKSNIIHLSGQNTHTSIN